jgi:23S rRNA (guanosine2251-2'-O)-methyltransferase
MRIFGFHAVLARLRRDPQGISELYIDANRTDPRMRELERLAQNAGVRLHGVDTQRIERLCPGKRHQGVVALAETSVPSITLEELLSQLDADPQTPATVLLLDGVTDPRNLGACLRVADGAGVSAVIAPKDHACMLTEAAIQTSSGAAESVPYLMVTNLARTIDTLQENGFHVIGTADETNDELYDMTLEGRIAWVLGAEGKGLRRLTRERCDRLVRIPMQGQVESLNVSVAAGVILYETLRQRQRASRA